MTYAIQEFYCINNESIDRMCPGLMMVLTFFLWIYTLALVSLSEDYRTWNPLRAGWRRKKIQTQWCSNIINLIDFIQMYVWVCVRTYMRVSYSGLLVYLLFLVFFSGSAAAVANRITLITNMHIWKIWNELKWNQ